MNRENVRCTCYNTNMRLLLIKTSAYRAVVPLRLSTLTSTPPSKMRNRISSVRPVLAALKSNCRMSKVMSTGRAMRKSKNMPFCFLSLPLLTLTHGWKEQPASNKTTNIRGPKETSNERAQLSEMRKLLYMLLSLQWREWSQDTKIHNKSDNDSDSTTPRDHGRTFRARFLEIGELCARPRDHPVPRAGRAFSSRLTLPSQTSAWSQVSDRRNTHAALGSEVRKTPSKSTMMMIRLCRQADCHS
jgi:hypothetical protein